MEQKNSVVKKPRKINKGFSKEEFEEYKKIMQSESQGGMSIYDYYYLEQNDM